eukprot:scaffold99_cov422-Pavlova_lutheri.AAC.1
MNCRRRTLFEAARPTLHLAVMLPMPEGWTKGCGAAPPLLLVSGYGKARRFYAWPRARSGIDQRACEIGARCR